MQTKYTMQKQQTTQNTAKQNYPDLVTVSDCRPGNEVTCELLGVVILSCSNHESSLSQTSWKVNGLLAMTPCRCMVSGMVQIIQKYILRPLTDLLSHSVMRFKAF